MDAALATLEEIFEPFSDITADALEGLPRMGEKSEPFCRQTALVLDQNLAVIPPSVDFKGLKEDFADLDALRPRLLRLRELLNQVENVKDALGCDILGTSLEGYGLMKMFGKSEGLESLRQAISLRNRGKGRKPASGNPDTPEA
jgi:hypothetical protein